MKAGKKSYYTVLDVYVGEHSKKRLIISSNVSHKFHNKKFTQFRGWFRESKWKPFYNYLGNTDLMFSMKTL